MVLGANGIFSAAMRAKHGPFDSGDRSELAMLGESVGRNTRLRRVDVSGLDASLSDAIATSGFFDGFRRNASIRDACLTGCTLSEGLGYETLKSLEDINGDLASLEVYECDLRNGGARVLASTLVARRSVRYLAVAQSEADDESIADLMLAIDGHIRLQGLVLKDISIGRPECAALASLLGYNNSNLVELDLSRTRIDDRCVTILANALRINKKITCLGLNGNPEITEIGFGALSKALCDASSVNDTFLSNHTLLKIECNEGSTTSDIRSLLQLNKSPDKREVAMVKIVRCHAQIDMASLFEWELKALPLAVDWFGRVHEIIGEAVANKGNVRAQMLSAVYQFAGAMPMMFVPASHRKRGAERNLHEVDESFLIRGH